MPTGAIVHADMNLVGPFLRQLHKGVATGLYVDDISTHEKINDGKYFASLYYDVDDVQLMHVMDALPSALKADGTPDLTVSGGGAYDANRHPLPDG